MDFDAYLRRIQFPEHPRPVLDHLKALQRHHQLHIPFENLDIHLSRKIILNPERIARKVIQEKRGGFCYELNGLFYHLLWQIGFDVKMISARVFTEEEVWSKPLSHLALIVDLEGELWLVDVGFGGFALEPLKLEEGLAQKHVDGIYWINRQSDGSYMMTKHAYGEEKIDKYTFTLQVHQFQDFGGMCHYQQTHPDSFFLKQRLCTQATPTGRKTLTDTKFIQTTPPNKHIQSVESHSQFKALLLQEFGIRYDEIALS